MTTLLEGQEEDTTATRHSGPLTQRSGRWAQLCALVGAAAWAALALLARAGIARIGAIELMFLFAPLVVVPLGMELARLLGSGGWIDRAARRLQPPGAALAIAALWLPPGRTAGALAFGWMLVCGLAGFSGISGFFDPAKSKVSSSFVVPTSPKTREKWATPFHLSTGSSTSRFAVALAQLDLIVGGAWFVASRLGMHPMEIQEPIGLLTAVHFHFAGFATAMIAAATLRFAQNGRWERSLRVLAPIVVIMPYVVAVGFVTSPTVKMGAGVLFSISVAGFAVVLRFCAQRTDKTAARVLLQVAAVTVFAGMVLASVYAIADLRGSDLLPIPQMARTHGILNAVGFCMCGLLGWIVEWETDDARKR